MWFQGTVLTSLMPRTVWTYEKLDSNSRGPKQDIYCSKYVWCYVVNEHMTTKFLCSILLPEIKPTLLQFQKGNKNRKVSHGNISTRLTPRPLNAGGDTLWGELTRIWKLVAKSHGLTTVLFTQKCLDVGQSQSSKIVDMTINETLVFVLVSTLFPPQHPRHNRDK